MTTVAELIEFLKTQPQEAIIQIVYHTSGSGYYDQGGNARWEDFDTEVDQWGYGETVEFVDFRDREPSVDKPWHGYAYLHLGHKE